MTPATWRWILLGLGLTYLALASWALTAPASFAAALANFGPGDQHLVRDFGACSAAFGIGLVVAARKPSWRTPVLTVTTLWNGLHAINHIIDSGKSHPAAVGPIEAALLVAATFLLAFLARASTQRASTQRAGTKGDS
ncbi:hypothetical protein EV652_103335 [Kribbella steppae]|uniref:Uncharacterized protein n=1 Tax=Kribbella steppae TaxID=2512223 RepID=A0A4R2HTK7_9ACTN|nr:hypothetical protein [Kribbella steppae]TCO33335.1 hypothetical protein EV652_103335 [Kribbella steppae]